MLDCGLDLSPLLHFLPAIYVKNYSSQVSKSKSFKLLHEIGNFMFLESNEMKIGVPDWSLVDLSRVDVLLISNHYNMLALPYLTEYTNFRGEIYATEPTIQIGRQSMKELVIHLEDQFAKLKQSTDLSPSNWQNTEAIPYVFIQFFLLVNPNIFHIHIQPIKACCLQCINRCYRAHGDGSLFTHSKKYYERLPE